MTNQLCLHVCNLTIFSWKKLESEFQMKKKTFEISYLVLFNDKSYAKSLTAMRGVIFKNLQSLTGF